MILQVCLDARWQKPLNHLQGLQFLFRQVLWTTFDIDMWHKVLLASSVCNEKYIVYYFN